MLLEFIAELLVRDLEDPRVRGVSLTGIKLRRDLRHATVYFNVLKEGNSQQALSGLEKATGFVRMKIGRELNLRFVPQIAWEYDETADRAERIEDLLKKSGQ